MSKIRVLKDETINQIAAGEVIENPSSVVKELLENAIDADAKKIVIEIEKGGFECIRMSDDGNGMQQDDALLSLERHATSKLTSSKDLLSLQTMGFRGEALASIASISKLSLVTCPKEASSGTKLLCHGGKILSHVDTARNRGTTFEVRSLFYNVPARKRFQKSVASSTSAIIKLVTNQILAHPNVLIRLLIDKKELYPSPGLSQKDSNLHMQMQRVLGESFVKDLREFSYESSGIILKGYLGEPHIAKQSRSSQYMFINTRPASCKEISFAIQDGYATRIEERKYPVYVLHLEIDPSRVDVNVHPQKLEVRLRDPHDVQHVIRSGISSFFSSKQSVTISPSAFTPIETNFPIHGMALEERKEKPLPLTMVDPFGVFGKFAFVAEEETLLLFDLTAIQEAIYYSRMQAAWEKGENPSAQALFFPIKIPLSIADAKILALHIDEVKQMGIDIRIFGETEFIVESIPPFIHEEYIPEIISEFVDTFRGLEKSKMALVKKLLSRIPRKKRFDLSAAKALLRQWTHQKPTNPFGKQIKKQVSAHAFEKLFRS